MRTPLTRWSALPLLALASIAAVAQNAYISNLSLGRFIEANDPVTIMVRARNVSSTPYFSCSVSWNLDGGPANNMANINIGGPGVVQNNYVEVTNPATMSAPQGPHVLRVWINTTVDSDHSNDTLVLPFVALEAFAPKVVLLEARTETWCPQCPPSNDETNDLMVVPEYAVAKFHTSDALSSVCPVCAQYDSEYNINYTPAGLVELGDYNTYDINSQWPGWGTDMGARAQGVSPLQLELISSLNWTTRVLTVTLEATFTYAVTGGELKMNVYALENLVPGPQENASSGYIHNRVMRGMLGDFYGTEGVIPSTPVVGTTYTHTYSWTVPSEVKLADLKLIGLVSHDMGVQGRTCINAVKSSASPVGIDEDAIAADRLVVYPNPFNQELAVIITGLNGKARTELVTMDGRLMDARTVVLNSSAPTRLDLGADIAPGAYVLRVITEQGIIERSVLKVD